MISKSKHHLRLLKNHIFPPKLNLGNKYIEEIRFWKDELGKYSDWYHGRLSSHYGENSPPKPQVDPNIKTDYAPLLSWLETHQKPKYLQDLELDPDVFQGAKILDIGCGPFPSASVFQGAEVYCLDPLVPYYLIAGFPIHLYSNNVRFAYGYSEQMPFHDHFFDAIISVNALDHVDDFAQTCKEIKRVLKPGGKLRIHFHYHRKTITEPVELNDDIINTSFAWNPHFKKIADSQTKRGSKLSSDKSEFYTLWSNF